MMANVNPFVQENSFLQAHDSSCPIDRVTRAFEDAKVCVFKKRDRKTLFEQIQDAAEELRNYGFAEKK